ncbi:MAG TPA: hypothetical protein DCM40_32350, partial [Maribacter sp.]|nr:hypothetical protein [Maribacter sp.]
FSNVAAASGFASTGTGGTGTVSGNIVTVNNFAQVLQDNLVIREMLKEDDTAPPSPANIITVTGGNIKENTESLYKNGIILAVGASFDYTISGNTITLAENLVEG